MNQIPISENFKKMTTRAIGSIILFIVSYSLLILFAVGLTGLFCLIAYTLFAYHASGYTLGLAFGLISAGVLILIFLIKFIFKKHSIDISHLTEISREQQPQLFKMIDEIAIEADTTFPKRIYLAADVNASVFYDSSIMSMFLPIKKNLHIGIGLINTVTVSELRAILAHEFGHFSQRTMKVGSYVYNTNKIIHNMLYDNESFDRLVEKWAGMSGYFLIFVYPSVWIIRRIQSILQKIYHHVNLNYLSLSREMEFHADEVAAHIAGSAPLISALLRMELADQSLQTVIDHYRAKESLQNYPTNVYPLQTFIMNFWAKKNSLIIDNNFPQITLTHLKRYYNSKLIISNQWASHPSTEDRVQHLIKLDIPAPQNNSQSALSIIHNKEALLSNISRTLFDDANTITTSNSQSQELFISEFLVEQKQNSFNEIYNGYYDIKNPSDIDVHANPIHSEDYSNSINILFGNNIIEAIYECRSLENDINTLEQIFNGHLDILSFDYDGTKYSINECTSLITNLDKELKLLQSKVLHNDQMIYEYCLHLENKYSDTTKLKSLYQSFLNLSSATDTKSNIYIQMANATSFMYDTMPFDTIHEKINALRKIEIDFKNSIQKLLADPTYHTTTTPEIIASFNTYLTENYRYFYDQSYLQNEVDSLFQVMINYNSILVNIHFREKKTLLDYQASLFEHIPVA
jgi:Zn-dependent protease with chaperone function